ncbi:MAG: DUF1579 domain-containing protein [Phycisphaerae bacterium]|nr:DUF1579 domain-containing protein [Phycisphaerae bacterium]
MKRTVFALVAAAGLIAMPAWAQDSGPTKVQDTTKKIEKKAGDIVDGAKKALEGQPEMDDSMKALMEASMPGKHHKFLEQLVGEWDAEVVMTMPGGHAQKSTGSMSSAMEFEGRFLRSKYSGSMMDMPFKGLSLWGYNNIDQRYEAIWIDSMSTGLYTNRGSVDDAGKVFTMHGEHTDAATRKTVKQREVITIVSPDKHTMEFFGTPEGTDDRVMIITYTRKLKSDAKPDSVKKTDAGDSKR